MHWYSRGARALAAALLPALGGRGCDFPSNSSHTRPPSGFGRALSTAPRSIAPSRDPTCGARLPLLTAPADRPGRPAVPTAGEEEVQPPQVQPLGATNHDSPLPLLSAGHVRPDCGCYASSHTPEQTPRLSPGVCRFRCTHRTYGFQSECPHSSLICPAASILPRTVLCSRNSAHPLWLYYHLHISVHQRSASTALHTDAHKCTHLWGGSAPLADCSSDKQITP